MVIFISVKYCSYLLLSQSLIDFLGACPKAFLDDIYVIHSITFVAKVTQLSLLGLLHCNNVMLHHNLLFTVSLITNDDGDTTNIIVLVGGGVGGLVVIVILITVIILMVCYCR